MTSQSKGVGVFLFDQDNECTKPQPCHLSALMLMHNATGTIFLSFASALINLDTFLSRKQTQSVKVTETERFDMVLFNRWCFLVFKKGLNLPKIHEKAVPT